MAQIPREHKRSLRAGSVLLMSLSFVAGCSMNHGPSLYTYSEWLGDRWIDYRVRDPDDSGWVAQWIRDHRMQLERAATIAPVLDREPWRTLQKRNVDGTVVDYELLAKYPADDRPKAVATYVENFAEMDLLDLRDHFVRYGARSARSAQSQAERVQDVDDPGDK